MNDGASTDTEAPPTKDTSDAKESKHTGWVAFHQRRVMVQLKEPYIVPTYPSYLPQVIDGGVKAAQSLPGVLFVEPDARGDGYMLILRVAEGENEFALIAIQPDNVEFCTHIVDSPLVRP